ncbi:MAG: dockerin type I repeat-containing protein [Ruminococcus sp.]|nr:dockerin type I repeat-containing protein [Ruminococcus sp.]
MKRIISILLAVMLVASCAVVASAYGWQDPDCLTVDQALEQWALDNGVDMPETYRYYFLMPNGSNGELGDDETLESFGKYAPTWYIPMADGTPATSTAGIYWWDSKVADPAAWIGYLPSGKEECDADIYYADVPVAATTIIWNNAVDGGMDANDPIYFCAAQSINIPSEYYDPGESPLLPDGTDNFNNMIFVIDPDLISINELSLKQTCGGEWHYYYGNGCYGLTKDGNETNCLRDDHFDADGNHVGKQTPSEIPTTPSEIPTTPSEIPSTPDDVVLGDVDGDGEMSIMDATELQLLIAGIKEWTDAAKAVADVDGDGDISILDATEIQLLIAGLK